MPKTHPNIDCLRSFATPRWPWSGVKRDGKRLARGFLVLHRMESAGYEVGLWRWPGWDFRLYSEYWRIAPQKGWSRWMLSGFLVCFGLAAAFLLSIPMGGGNLLE